MTGDAAVACVSSCSSVLTTTLTPKLPPTDGRPMSATAAFQSNVTSTPLSFDVPALMYDTFVAVTPPVDGLRMIRWHACVGDVECRVALRAEAGPIHGFARLRRDHSLDEDAVPVDAAREPRKQRMLPARLEDEARGLRGRILRIHLRIADGVDEPQRRVAVRLYRARSVERLRATDAHQLLAQRSGVRGVAGLNAAFTP